MNHVIDLDIVIYICTLIASISGAALIIGKVIKKSVSSAAKEIIDERLKKSDEEHKKSIDEMEYRMNTKISALQDSVDTKISEIRKQLDDITRSQNDVNSKMQSALLASTRDRINQAHDYYMRKDFIGTHSLYIIEQLYESYKELGGNSFIKDQMKDIHSLEVRSAEMNIKD
jgi:hypothetical protein